MFVCRECNYKSVKWLGKCPSCASWESFKEEANPSRKRNILQIVEKSTPHLLKDIKQQSYPRVFSGIEEFDRVIGGGFVKGEVVLVGGEPGIGKSTLLFQVAGSLSKEHRCLYVSAEESDQQIALRAERVKADCDNLYVLNEDNLVSIYEYIKEYKIEFVIIDSIQVVHNPQVDAARGSPNQIRGSAEFLTRLAKTCGITVVIVGHVTKEGIIAGPKLMEHVVDCVLYFESETISNYRILRATKNRFGSTGEIAIFEMTSKGLRQQQSLTDIFLPHKDNPIAGSCVGCVMEGLKPMMIELQALVSKSNFGVSRRRASGFDFNRFSILIATLEKRAKIPLATQDIFLNAAGGIKITDTGADVAAAMAIISSFKEKPLEEKTAFIGEVGLGGELRPVSNINLRLKEVHISGFKKCFIPKGNVKEVNTSLNTVALFGSDSLQEVLQALRRS